jgi:hypothetical protein
MNRKRNLSCEQTPRGRAQTPPGPPGVCESFPYIPEWAGATRNRTRVRHHRRPVALLERGENVLGIGRHAVEDLYAEIQSSREIPASFKMVLMRTR